MTRLARIPAADLWILAVCAVVLLVGLGSSSVRDRDEARYGIVAHEMLERGNPWTMTLHGEPYFNKAPLRIWMTAALAAVFGLDEWTLRLPSAAMALGVVGLLLWLGRRWFDAATSRWAVVVLMASTQWLYLHGARSGEMDSSLLFFWLLAVVAAERAPDDGRWLWLCGAAIGAAGMVKHAAYVAPVALTVVGWAAVSGSWRSLRMRDVALGLGSGAAVLVPWHAWQLAHYGQDFVDGYLGREVVERVTHDYRASYGWSYYFVVLKDGWFPWSLALPFALLGAWRSRTGGFLAGWVVAILAILVLGQQDLPWYVFMALPPAALLIARGVRGAPARLGAGLWGWVGIVLALSPSNVLHYDVHAQPALDGMIRGDLFGVLGGATPWWPQVVASLLVVVCAGAGWRLRSSAWVQRAALAFAAFGLIHAILPLRTMNHRSDLDRLCQALRAQNPSAVVAVLGDDVGSTDLVAFELLGVSDDVRVVTGASDGAPQAWRIGRTATLGRDGAAFLVGDWVARAPELRR